MIQINKLDFQPYVEIAKRRKWWIITSLVLFLAFGFFYYLESPKMYKATTLILLEAQRVPQNYVSSTISDSLENRLNTIYQQVHSRTNLEKIIKDFQLYPVQKEKGPIEQLRIQMASFMKNSEASNTVEGNNSSPISGSVGDIRNKIDVSLRGNNRAIEITFEWYDPFIAAEVTNAIASQFISQNLKVREEIARGTTNFLDSEVLRIRQDLELREKSLEEFKRKHMGELPNQLQSNLQILNQLKEELNNLEKRVDMENNQAMMIASQINYITGRQKAGSTENSDGVSIKDLENELNQLMTRYTVSHPDVIALKTLISKTKRNQQSITTRDASTQDSGIVEDNPTIFELNSQLNQIKYRISTYERQIRDVRTQIREYKQRVENTSNVELQLKDLERDYEAVNKRYQEVLTKKLDAQMAEELEKRQQGEKFRIVDPAVPPNGPYKPDMGRIMVVALMLGLGMGGGLAYIKESLDPVFYTPEEIEKYLGTKVIASLSYVEKK